MRRNLLAACENDDGSDAASGGSEITPYWEATSEFARNVDEFARVEARHDGIGQPIHTGLFPNVQQNSSYSLSFSRAWTPRTLRVHVTLGLLVKDCREHPLRIEPARTAAA
jgi:hypothetical protein